MTFPTTSTPSTPTVPAGAVASVDTSSPGIVAPYDSQPKPNVLIVVGSLRKRSFSRQLADEVEQLLAPYAHVRRLDYADLPYMNQDLEPEATESVRRVRQEAAAADGIWFVTPEYNHSIPGVLKNLIDWLSRPKETGNQHPVAGKTVTYCGAAGSSGASYVFGSMNEILRFLGLEIVEASPTGVRLNRKNFETDTLSLTDEERTSLRIQCDSFLKALREKYSGGNRAAHE